MLVRAVAICMLLALAVLPASADARGLRLGFLDDVFSQGPAERDPWLARSVESGSDILRLSSSWVNVAPTRPGAPTDPADPAYRWDSLDTAVKAANARGLDVIISLTGAPQWATAKGRPGGVNPVAWRPRAAPYGEFARALAKRYSGSYRDPERPGATLPRVRTYLPWNEPNLTTYLAPSGPGRGAASVPRARRSTGRCSTPSLAV